MRIERPHLTGATDIPARARNASPSAKAEGEDTVSLRFASGVDRADSIDADSYDPRPIDIALALINRGFDR